MKFRIKKSSLASLYFLCILIICALVTVLFLQKSAWRLAVLFSFFALFLIVLDIYKHIFLFANSKIIKLDHNLYLESSQGNLKKIIQLKYFSKFFILLKLEKGRFKTLPIWVDSLNKEDWNFVRIESQKIIYYQSL